MLSTEFRTIEEFPSYEINEDGIVRNIQTGKLKNITHDSKGRALVVLYKEDKGEKGYAVSLYISELLHKIFGLEPDTSFSESERMLKLRRDLDRAKGLKEEYEEEAESFSEIVEEPVNEKVVEENEVEIKEESEEVEEMTEEKEVVKEVKEETKTETKAKRTRKKTTITCNTTGEVFNSYREVTNKYNFNYDKFYNMFYYSKIDTINYSGLEFTKKIE